VICHSAIGKCLWIKGFYFDGGIVIVNGAPVILELVLGNTPEKIGLGQVGFKPQYNIKIFDGAGVIPNLGARLTNPHVMVDVHLRPGLQKQGKQGNY